MPELELLASVKSFGGLQQRYRHRSHTNQCDMTFSIYLPPRSADNKPHPLVIWLSGLTCNDENFVQKAGAQRYASELGLIIVTPDTSPRGDDVPDDAEGAWDFGLGAGFYVNASEAPWSQHYHMFDYVNVELPKIIAEHFSWNGKASISGHSMGGHGALISALRHPHQYRSASAFAPIANPTDCPWGEKALGHFLGNNREAWAAYDTCKLLQQNPTQLPILVDQGDDDSFLDEQLKIDRLERAVAQYAKNARIDRHKAYDHSYFFIATFIEKHLKFHAQYLNSDN